MANNVTIASAGSGKTTTVVRRACADTNTDAALVTYTLNGRDEIRNNAYRHYGHIPSNVTIYTWFTFLLRHFVRPLQRCIEEQRVSGLNFVTGQSARFAPESNPRRHYFTSNLNIHSDKVSKFACRVIELTDGAPIARIERIYKSLFIDECQDLAGYDLELIEVLLRSEVNIELVGDHRQATFSTHSTNKNRQFAGAKIVEKFKEWETSNMCDVEFQNISRRCIQEICDFADQFYPDVPPTTSLNKTVTDHDGVFAVRKRDVKRYDSLYSPQPLRYDRRTRCDVGNPINFGASKGMTFDRTLIYPHGGLKKFLKSSNVDDAGKAIEKIYVAVTRARQSTAFVVDDDFESTNVRMFEVPVT